MNRETCYYTNLNHPQKGSLNKIPMTNGGQSGEFLSRLGLFYLALKFEPTNSTNVGRALYYHRVVCPQPSLVVYHSCYE